MLPGVAVGLVVGSHELSATSDSAGRYRFDEVPPGTAALTFRLLDFGVRRRTVP